MHHPKGGGVGAILADAGTVAALFDPGKRISYGSMNLAIESCDRSQVMRVDTDDVISLTIKLRGWEHRA